MALTQRSRSMEEKRKSVSRPKFICPLIFNKCTNSMEMGKCSQQMLLEEVDIYGGGGEG